MSFSSISARLDAVGLGAETMIVGWLRFAPLCAVTFTGLLVAVSASFPDPELGKPVTLLAMPGAGMSLLAKLISVDPESRILSIDRSGTFVQVIYYRRDALDRMHETEWFAALGGGLGFCGQPVRQSRATAPPGIVKLDKLSSSA